MCQRADVLPAGITYHHGTLCILPDTTLNNIIVVYYSCIVKAVLGVSFPCYIAADWQYCVTFQRVTLEVYAAVKQ